MTGIYKTPETQRMVEEKYRAFLQYWPVPNGQFTVPTRHGETFVIACGEESAPAILLLHGALANSTSWMGDVATLPQHSRVFAVDLIGEPGLSAQSRPPLGSAAYAEWLDDVRSALGLKRLSLVGLSLGGWIALDYATRHPERIDRLVLICPGGVGRQKVAILFQLAFLSLLGAWGKRKMRELILGGPSPESTPAVRKFAEFIGLLHESTYPRRDRLPIFGDDALRRLRMPVLVIVGGKDVLLDSDETRRRMETQVPGAKVHYLEGAGHFIPGQTAVVSEFLRAVEKPEAVRQ